MTDENESVATQHYVEFTKQNWTYSGRGAYSGRLDRRDLYNICHEWVPSNTGDFG